MADDWRLTVDFDDEGDGTQLVERLSARRFESDERDRLGGRVVVSRDGPRVFFYADSEECAREAEHVATERLAAEGLQARVAFERWHPVEQDWKDAEHPPSRHGGRARGRARAPAGARGGRVAEASGDAEWEVRVSLPSHEATDELADMLEARGDPGRPAGHVPARRRGNQDEATRSPSASGRRLLTARRSRSSRAAPGLGGQRRRTRSRSSAGSAADTGPLV